MLRTLHFTFSIAIFTTFTLAFDAMGQEIRPAFEVVFPTESNTQYLIEESSDMQSWRAIDMVLGSGGPQSVFVAKKEQSFFRATKGDPITALDLERYSWAAAKSTIDSVGRLEVKNIRPLESPEDYIVAKFGFDPVNVCFNVNETRTVEDLGVVHFDEDFAVCSKVVKADFRTRGPDATFDHDRRLTTGEFTGDFKVALLDLEPGMVIAWHIRTRGSGISISLTSPSGETVGSSNFPADSPGFHAGHLITESGDHTFTMTTPPLRTTSVDFHFANNNRLQEIKRLFDGDRVQLNVRSDEGLYGKYLLRMRKGEVLSFDLPNRANTQWHILNALSEHQVSGFGGLDVSFVAPVDGDYHWFLVDKAGGASFNSIVDISPARE